MDLALLTLAAITLCAYLVAAGEVSIGGSRIAQLDRIAPIVGPAPAVSIVIPACNEQRHIEEALSSVLAQDYPDFEVIAVDDRSTDATGAILDRMSARTALLRVLHVRELPPGWLGKNHALHEGAAIARGALILFTDADVVMDRTVLRRAVAYLEREKIDHLAVAPKAEVRSFLGSAFLGVFALLFSMHTKPWKLRDPKHRAHIGIGAFNLVRAAAYRAVGGHQSIAMRPDDDLKLGKLLKARGFVQDLVFGTRLLHVEWYASFSEMARGLTKNFFASVDYNVWPVVGAVIAQLLLLVWPWIAICVTRGAVQVLNALTVLTLVVSFVINGRRVGIRWTWCFTMPIAALVSIYLLLRSTVLNLVHDGIEWRGTHYPLSELRRNTADF